MQKNFLLLTPIVRRLTMREEKNYYGICGQFLKQINQLIAKGEGVLASAQPIPNLPGFLALDSSAFSEWDSQSMSS